MYPAPLIKERGTRRAIQTEKLSSRAVIFFAQRIHLQGKKPKIFIQGSLPFFQDPDYPANKSLFTGLIRQISYYLPDESGK